MDIMCVTSVVSVGIGVVRSREARGADGGCGARRWCLRNQYRDIRYCDILDLESSELELPKALEVLAVQGGGYVGKRCTL